MSMSKEQWESLQGNPGWAALRAFLTDHRGAIMEKWADGQLHGADADRAASQCSTLADIAGLEWRDVARFYGMWTDEDEDKYQGHQQ